jgi:hypothetical protein
LAKGAVGCTTTTDPRSQRNRAGRKGRAATNASSQLIEHIGLPTLHAPSAPQPGWSHHTRRSPDLAGLGSAASIMPVTNLLERLNEEIRRRTRVVRIFPNLESCLRLVRALAVEIHEGWLEPVATSTWTWCENTRRSSSASS